MDRARTTERKMFKAKQEVALRNLNSDRMLNSKNKDFASKTLTNSFIRGNNAGVAYLTGRLNAIKAGTEG